MAREGYLTAGASRARRPGAAPPRGDGLASSPRAVSGARPGARARGLDPRRRHRDRGRRHRAHHARRAAPSAPPSARCSDRAAAIERGGARSWRREGRRAAGRARRARSARPARSARSSAAARTSSAGSTARSARGASRARRSSRSSTPRRSRTGITPGHAGRRLAGRGHATARGSGGRPTSAGSTPAPVTLRRALMPSANAADGAREPRGRRAAGGGRCARKAASRGALDPVPSLALGAVEVTPLELVAAYAPFANGGLPGRSRRSSAASSWRTAPCCGARPSPSTATG